MDKASNWFTDVREYRQLCGDAQSQARSETEQQFAAERMLAANQYGLEAFLSVKQLAWLCRLADWEQPRKINK